MIPLTFDEGNDKYYKIDYNRAFSLTCSTSTHANYWNKRKRLYKKNRLNSQRTGWNSNMAAVTSFAAGHRGTLC